MNFFKVHDTRKFSPLAAVLILGIAPMISAAPPVSTEYRELEWGELLPTKDLEALLSPPSWINDIDDGSPFDDPDLFASRAQESLNDLQYEQALRSFSVRADLAGQKVRLPGYIVPLAFDDQQRVIEFFLVPYMGACLHMPPPPPNQIIYANYEVGVELESLWVPYWIEGELVIQTVNNYLADSAYSINLSNVEEFTY